MPFNLKNVGATYQRMMIKKFREKIGHTVEVYIADMVVKSKEDQGHVGDLADIFEVFKQHRLASMPISAFLVWGLANSSAT